MKNIIPVCKSATELIEKQLFFGLTYTESMRLELHLKICEACTNYRLQSKIIDSALHQMNVHLIDKRIVLSDGFKQRIINQINTNK